MSDLMPDLDSIVIENPCKVDWNSMTGDEKTRFCGQCKLNVHNISEMEDEEIRELFKTSSDSNSKQLCLRMYKRPDGTVVRRNCQFKVRQLKKALHRSVASIVGLTAWFTLAQPVLAQSEPEAKVTAAKNERKQVNNNFKLPTDFLKGVNTAIACRDGRTQTIYSLGMLFFMGIIFLGAVVATIIAIKKGSSYFAVGGILVGTTFVLGFMWTVYDSLKARELVMGSMVAPAEYNPNPGQTSN